MKDADLIRALKRMGVQTGGLMCVGCGHEHNCGVHGCAVIREAAQRLEDLSAKGTAELGDPLTVEQLRKMDGECVKVVVEGVEPLEMLALVEVPKDEDCVLLRNNLGGVSEFYSDEDLREDGVKVYAYPPAHIDWDAWEGCDFCQKELDDYPYVAARGDFSESDTCYKPSYCPICGKPITPEAQAELEKRLRG